MGGIKFIVGLGLGLDLLEELFLGGGEFEVEAGGFIILQN